MLSPLSLIYKSIIEARNLLYRKNIFKTHSLGAPTISIGNITVGGTGKTPLVAFIAEILIEQGETVCILTRGYGRENKRERVLVSDGKKILADVKKSGDEPFELANKLFGKTIIVADADRAAAGNWARKKFGVTAFVLDDAFQHRRVKRDLDLVCVDATNPFGNEKVLPSGILRESLSNLKRADAVVITRANLTDENQISSLKSQINLFTNCPIFLSENKISNLISLKDFLAGSNKMRDFEVLKQSTDNSYEEKYNDKFLAFCALGNPENFFAQLRQEKFTLTATEAFPDHHFYTQKDIDKLEQKAERFGAEILLTTGKDAVKLKNLNFSLKCFVVEIKTVFKDEKRLREIINAVFSSKSKS